MGIMGLDWKRNIIFLLVVSTSYIHGFINTSPFHTRIPHPAEFSSHLSHTHSALFAKKNKKKKNEKGGAGRTVAVNRVAFRNYEVLETLEAGISLTGTEVKAIRDGKLNLRDGYIRPSRNFKSCFLHNVHVGKHATAGAYFQHEERRVRPLLMHKSQALKWAQQTDRAPGMTIVPLKAYFNKDNKLKLEIALVRGKNVRDKRATIQERDAKREANRMIKSFRLG